METYKTRISALTLEIPDPSGEKSGVRAEAGGAAAFQRPLEAPPPRDNARSGTSPKREDTGPAAAGSRRAWAAGGLLVVLAALGAMVLHEPRKSGGGADFIPLAVGRTVGLIVEDGTISSVDWKRREIFTVERGSAKILRVNGIPNAHLSGLSLGEKSVWSTDRVIGRIYRHRVNDYVVLRAYPSPGRTPTAVHWDGTFLWTADPREGMLYQHAVGTTLRVVFQSPLALERPVGIFRRKGILWIMDAATEHLHRYRIPATEGPRTRSLVAAGSVDLGAFLPEGSTVTGFTMGEGYAWVVTESPSGIRRFDPADWPF